MRAVKNVSSGHFQVSEISTGATSTLAVHRVILPLEGNPIQTALFRESQSYEPVGMD